ncbi:MAG: hypothetical protein SRB2_03102 [Desulfobacteraceae bacterium Eth-SRB2]|nr:MAG: hypothetical protein SRB2_03102 [Desulfobacteraceae bacterium Eth-SRB2]
MYKEYAFAIRGYGVNWAGLRNEEKGVLDIHDFMRFSFNENHNVNIPAPQPLFAVCGIPWHVEYLSGKHTSFST